MELIESLSRIQLTHDDGQKQGVESFIFSKALRPDSATPL